MPLASENRASLIAALASTSDPFFAEFGFRRTRRGMSYIRLRPEARQALHFHSASNPSYFPGVVLHIQPKLEVVIPSVARIALQMVGDPRLLSGAPDIVVFTLLELLEVPSRQQRWCVSSAAELPACLASIHDGFRRLALPLFEDYSSGLGLTSSYEAGDRRPLIQQHWYVYVAAAYILQNRRSEARAVLERHLGTPGLRERFAAAHAYAA